MGSYCCADRDKPKDEESPPEAIPAEGFVTKKPKSIVRTVLMVGDASVLGRLVDMFSRDYRVQRKDKSATVFCEEWTFEISQTTIADVGRTPPRPTQVVFFLFDLQDSRLLDTVYSSATTFKAQTRKDAARFLVGYNPNLSSVRTSEKAANYASDLQFIYFEIPFPKESSHKLIEKMKESHKL